MSKMWNGKTIWRCCRTNWSKGRTKLKILLPRTKDLRTNLHKPTILQQSTKTVSPLLPRRSLRCTSNFQSSAARSAELTSFMKSMKTFISSPSNTKCIQTSMIQRAVKPKMWWRLWRECSIAMRCLKVRSSTKSSSMSNYIMTKATLMLNLTWSKQTRSLNEWQERKIVRGQQRARTTWKQK